MSNTAAYSIARSLHSALQPNPVRLRRLIRSRSSRSRKRTRAGVDARHFYAVDNYVIGKYDKKTGKLVKKWQGDKKGPYPDLDSAMLMDGKLYAAHSNYPQWP